MKTPGYWQGIKGWWIDDPESPDGKRFTATPTGMKKINERGRTEVVLCEVRNGIRCNRVGSEWHHIYGKGGGKHEDRLTVAGIVYRVWTCRSCHPPTQERRLGIEEIKRGSDVRQTTGEVRTN